MSQEEQPKASTEPPAKIVSSEKVGKFGNYLGVILGATIGLVATMLATHYQGKNAIRQNDHAARRDVVGRILADQHVARAADYILNKTRINMSFYQIAIQLSKTPEDRQSYSHYLNQAYASELGQMSEVNQARRALLKDIGEALLLFNPTPELRGLAKKTDEALHDLVLPTRPPHADLNEAIAWNGTAAAALEVALNEREEKFSELPNYIREQYLGQGE